MLFLIRSMSSGWPLSMILFCFEDGWACKAGPNSLRIFKICSRLNSEWMTSLIASIIERALTLWAEYSYISCRSFSSFFCAGKPAGMPCSEEWTELRMTADKAKNNGNTPYKLVSKRCYYHRSHESQLKPRQRWLLSPCMSILYVGF